MRRLKVDDYSVAAVWVPAIFVNLLPGMTLKTISEVQRNYRPYCSLTVDDEDQPVDFRADIVGDADDMFAQEAL